MLNMNRDKMGADLASETHVKFNTNLLQNTFVYCLMLRHVSAFTVGHLQGAFFNLRSFCFNLHGKKSAKD